MKKYAKIENEETKECSVFIGEETIENVKWAVETMGMSLMEVEEAYNKSWYLEKFAPIQPLIEVKNIKLQELEQKSLEYFLNKYPDYKQRNLAIVGSDEEKLQFKNFHEKHSLQYHDYKDKINGSKTLKELNKITINFENIMK